MFKLEIKGFESGKFVTYIVKTSQVKYDLAFIEALNKVPTGLDVTNINVLERPKPILNENQILGQSTIV